MNRANLLKSGLALAGGSPLASVIGAETLVALNISGPGATLSRWAKRKGLPSTCA